VVGEEGTTGGLRKMNDDQKREYTSNKMIKTKNALKGPYWIGDVCHEGTLPKGLFPGTELPTVVCIVDLVNRTRQGITKSGVPLYLAYPLNPSYPPIIMGSREKDLSCNKFALVKVKGYEDAFRWPRGEFLSWIGPVGNIDAERMALIAMSGSTKSPPLESVCITEPISILDWNTCNIDPSGCKDIDDVISWRKEGGKVVEVAISIADVSFFIQPGTPEDKEASRRGQSLYAAAAVVCPMIHPVLSEGAASLKADGIARPVVSLHLPSLTWKRQFLINRQTYTYEDAPKELKEVFVFCGSTTEDPHEWIERAMIFYNVEAAKQIAGYGILRTQAPPDMAKAAMWNTAATAAGMPALALLGYSAGSYARKGAHWALREEVYCHATSPLRRYADLVNQRCLVALLEGKTPLTISNEVIEGLNERSRIAKQLDRSQLSIPLDTIVEGEGIVLDICELKVGVYFLPWRSRITIRVLEPYSGAIGDRRLIKGFCDHTIVNLKKRMVWKLHYSIK
jgi:hypothetical protein